MSPPPPPLEPISGLVGKVIDRKGMVKAGRFVSRWARRMARASRMNWRRNDLRPLGRGYDWARTLVAEELLRRCNAADHSSAPFITLEVKAAELAGAVRCCVRIVRRSRPARRSWVPAARARRQGTRRGDAA